MDDPSPGGSGVWPTPRSRPRLSVGKRQIQVEVQGRVFFFENAKENCTSYILKRKGNITKEEMLQSKSPKDPHYPEGNYIVALKLDPTSPRAATKPILLISLAPAKTQQTHSSEKHLKILGKEGDSP
jgi:hypothetical protein